MSRHETTIGSDNGSDDKAESSYPDGYSIPRIEEEGTIISVSHCEALKEAAQAINDEMGDGSVVLNFYDDPGVFPGWGGRLPEEKKRIVIQSTVRNLSPFWDKVNEIKKSRQEEK